MNKYKELTTEQKVAFTTGGSDWTTTDVGNIPQTVMLDGPHGLHLIGDHKKSVCYPPACLTAASFDRNVTKTLGSYMGRQARAWGIGMILGPGLNIKRSPLCGRNFEYFSEDPYLAGEMAASYVQGVQQEGVVACVKHYLANNQECRRRSVSANIDERALRELYLENFRIAIQKGKPKAVMSSYNCLNGEQVSHSYKYLTKELREGFGFDGMVVSDWGAVKDRVKAIKAGCDLTMPSEHNLDKNVLNAIESGELTIEEVDRACERIEAFCDWCNEDRGERGEFSLEEGHKMAVELAKECFVLLKNDDKILPICEDKNVLFVGELGLNPRYQGGGSSRTDSFKVLGIDEAAKGIANVDFAKGYDVNLKEDSETLLAEAVAKAKNADVVVAVVGLPQDSESEGFDRFTFDIPDNELEMLDRLVEVNENVVVVLMNGSAVSMPFVNKVKGILECYLGGEGVTEAIIDTLYGKSNPSGRLPESIPERIEDNPSYLFFPGDKDVSLYGESIYVGYRYYETKKIRPTFDFGYGLSYTEFSYSNLVAPERINKEDKTIAVSVDVENIGTMDGKEVLQLYVEDKSSGIHRPKKELKGFDKIFLAKGEKKTVTFELERRAFAFYDEEVGRFVVPEGEYVISFGRSCHENAIEVKAFVEGDVVRSKEKITLFTPISEVLKTKTGKKFVEEALPVFDAWVEKSGYLSGALAEKMKTMSKEEIEKSKAVGLYTQPLNTLARALPYMNDTKWMDLLDEINTEE